VDRSVPADPAAHERTRTVPVILLSARTQAEDRAARAGRRTWSAARTARRGPPV